MRSGEFSVGTALLVMAVALFLVLFAVNIPVSGPSWGDWAGWFQAVGSVAAIVGSFELGRRQADRARQDAIDAELRDRKRKEEGYRSVVRHLVNEVASISKLLDKNDVASFSKAWEAFLKSAATAATAAFDSLPSYDLGTTERIVAAFALREVAQDFYGEIASVVVATDREAAYAALRGRSSLRFKHLTELTAAFDRTYSPSQHPG